MIPKRKLAAHRRIMPELPAIIDSTVKRLAAVAGSPAGRFVCSGCGKTLRAQDCKRASMLIHHKNPDKPYPYLLNCGPVEWVKENTPDQPPR